MGVLCIDGVGRGSAAPEITGTVWGAVATWSYYSGDSARAEREFVEGITLAESIGELRLAMLLKGSVAVLRADQASDSRAGGLSNGYDTLSPTGSGIDRVDPQRLLDEALQTALDNFQKRQAIGGLVRVD